MLERDKKLQMKSEFQRIQRARLDNARPIPAATRKPPVIRFRAVEYLSSNRLAEPANTAQSMSPTSSTVRKTSAATASSTVAPSPEFTNCGRKAALNNRVFGLAAATAQPRQNSFGAAARSRQPERKAQPRRLGLAQWRSSRKPNSMPPRCAKFATPGAPPLTPRYSSNRP